MTITADSTRTDSRVHREGRPATILTCADPGWDDARQAWNLAVDQHPAAIALPESAHDVAAAIGFARHRGLRVAAQSTGHNAGPLGDLADTVLIKTHAMRGLVIDPAARVARAEAGVIWQEVADAAGRHGLAGLAGSSPDVGVVGYTLGGGLSWLGRTYGLSASNVEAFELVTADGRLVRADAASEPDLFWALRGGGGSFGVVTAIELRLFPITEVYAGLLWWPAGAASQVLQAWRELTQGGLPDEFTTTARLMNFPPIPDIPEQIRGRSFTVIDVIHLGAAAEADRLLAPLRALDPVTDSIQKIPVPALGHLHMDPEHPVPAKGDGLLLASLPAQAIEAVTADGRLVRADACTEPDLFWALRGGGGSFAVVTAIELRLFGVTEVYAGLLWWPIEAGGEVLHAWQELTASGLPDEFTTTFRFLRFPDVQDVPEPVRGGAFAVVDAIHLGTPAEGEALLAPLRKLRPVTDTMAMISMPALSHLHMDPEHPVPGVGDGIMLASLPAEAVTRLLGVAGPGTGSPLGVELRHVGGEMKRTRPGKGALAAVNADYALFAASAAPTPQAVSAIGHGVAAVLSAMAPWAAAQTYLNLTETRRDPASFWAPQVYGRLRRFKAAVDPTDLIRANHPIPPARPEQAAPSAQDHAILQPAG